MILHQIEALADVGVTDVVLAVNYRPEIMENRLKEVSDLAPIRAWAQGLHTEYGLHATRRARAWSVRKKSGVPHRLRRRLASRQSRVLIVS